jgi:hypothetical protein
VTFVPLSFAKALMLLAFTGALLPAGAADLSPAPAGGFGSGVASQADSAALADLSLETLMLVSVAPAASAIGKGSARPSEVYALHYVVPGAGLGAPVEQMRQEHLAMHRIHVREF